MFKQRKFNNRKAKKSPRLGGRTMVAEQLEERRLLTFVPPGLSPGDSYHLIFACSQTIDRSFGSSAAGDAFIQGCANSSGLTDGANYQAILSDSGRNAISLLPVGTNVPIFNLGGQLVANDWSDMWIGPGATSLSNPIGFDETGNPLPGFAEVWTGTDAFGLHKQSGGDWTGAPLLDTTIGIAAGPNSHTDHWIDVFTGNYDPVTTQFWMYGISDALVAPSITVTTQDYTHCDADDPNLPFGSTPQQTLQIAGTKLNDTIHVSMSGGGTMIDVWDGTSTNSYPAAAVTQVKILGAGGDDDIRIIDSFTNGFVGIGGPLGSRSIFISGGDGMDYIEGSRTGDCLLGDADDDTIYGRRGSDWIDGGDDADVIYAGWGEDEVFGGSGDDDIFGGHDTDTIRAGVGDDYVQGNGQGDIIFGELGDDVLIGNGGRDAIIGGAGEDKIWGVAAPDWLHGGDNDDDICGGDGADSLLGRANDDVLFGEAGNDWFHGGSGADAIDGGANGGTGTGGSPGPGAETDTHTNATITSSIFVPPGSIPNTCNPIPISPLGDLNSDGVINQLDLSIMEQEVQAGNLEPAFLEAWTEIVLGYEADVARLPDDATTFAAGAANFQTFGLFGDVPDTRRIGFDGVSGVIAPDFYQASHGVRFENLGGLGAQAEGDSATIESLDGYDGTYRPDGDTVYASLDNHIDPFTILFDDPVSSVGSFIGTGKEGTIDTLVIEAFDASGTEVASYRTRVQSFDNAQNREGFWGLRTEDSVIASVTIRNDNPTDFGNALIVDDIVWSRAPDYADTFANAANAFSAFFAAQTDPVTVLSTDDATIDGNPAGDTTAHWNVATNTEVRLNNNHTGDCDDPGDLGPCRLEIATEASGLVGALDGYDGTFASDGSNVLYGEISSDPTDPDSDADGIEISFDNPVSSFGASIATAGPPDKGKSTYVGKVTLLKGFDNSGNLIAEETYTPDVFNNFDNFEMFVTLGTGTPNISSVLIQFLDEDGSVTDEPYSWSVDNLTFTAPDTALACDFNADGACDGQDIDALVEAISVGSMDPLYDLNEDGAVNLFDLEEWRVGAGAFNLGSGQVYLPADGNLDGVVDGADFILWNSHKFTSGSNWTGGDWNADGVTDGADFILWNTHKFTSSDTAGRTPGGAKSANLIIDRSVETEDQEDERQTVLDVLFARELDAFW